MQRATAREPGDIKVLIVGAGPAGLACAIRLKRKLNSISRKDSVVVIDKAPKIGYHSLSGAVLETDCLDELMPGWRQEKDSIINQMVKIERDALYYLTAKWAIRFPPFLVPASVRHKGDYCVSISKLAAWLGAVAEREGVEVYPGFAGSRLLTDHGRVLGVKLADLGLDRDGKPQSNFLDGSCVVKCPYQNISWAVPEGGEGPRYKQM